MRVAAEGPLTGATASLDARVKLVIQIPCLDEAGTLPPTRPSRPASSPWAHVRRATPQILGRPVA